MSFNNYIYFGYDTVTYCDSCNNFLKELGGCQKQGHRKFELGKDYTINENNCYDCNYFELAEDRKEMINHLQHYNMGKFEAIDVFKSITDEMTRLFEIKNKNYGNSFSKQFQEYGLTSVCIRLEDKLNRLKSLNKQISEAKNGIVDINVDDESIKDTLIDLANYSVLAIMEISKGE